MLTEREKQWLEERKNLCDRCPKRAYCRTGKKHNFNTQDCRFWEVYAPRKGSWTHEVRENFKDAAEFEARVAAKLVSNNFPCRTCTDFLIATKCPITTRGTSTDYGPFPCLLRQARFAVEEEMQ